MSASIMVHDIETVKVDALMTGSIIVTFQGAHERLDLFFEDLQEVRDLACDILTQSGEVARRIAAAGEAA